MTLDKSGQHFYNSSGEVFGEMAVKNINNQNYIAFSVPSEYNQEISDGMAWGITTSSDNKFYPILFIKNFSPGNQQSDDAYGQLILNACDLILKGMETGIVTGNVRMYGNVLNGITFEDTQSGNTILNIIPQNGEINSEISILDNISFFKNTLGSNSFKIGNNIVITDDGIFNITDGAFAAKGGMFYLGMPNAKASITMYPSVYVDVQGNLNVNGQVYANNISSDKRIKKNIKRSTKNALDIIKQIKHKQFEMKEDNKHYDIGYIAQEMERIDPNFVLIKEKTENTEDRYYINELPILATTTKAIQEQQEQIEGLIEKDKQKDKIIQDLIKRIEVLEKGANNE